MPHHNPHATPTHWFNTPTCRLHTPPPCLQAVTKVPATAADALTCFVQGAQQLKELRQASGGCWVSVWCMAHGWAGQKRK